MFHFWQVRPCSCILLQIKEQYCAIIIKRHRMIVTIGIEINCYQTKYCYVHYVQSFSLNNCRTNTYNNLSQIFANFSHFVYYQHTYTYTYRGPCVRKLFTGLIMYLPSQNKEHCIVFYCIVHFNKLVTLCHKVRCGIQFLIHQLIMRVFT